MNRRYFLFGAALSLLRAAPGRASRITRVVFAPVVGRFHKFVAMNSYDMAPKGRTYTNTLVRIFTRNGPEGVGAISGSVTPELLKAAKALTGADPRALYRIEDGRITGRSQEYAPVLEAHKHLDGPLFDLIGKLDGKPCWKLMGEAARQRIEVYDGTLYFSDIWFKERGVRAVVDEAEEAVRSGYRGTKFKVGRGWKWMDKDSGLQRDIEVLEAVRRAVGPDQKILADANNGYRNDFERAWKLISETRGVNLHWMEEIFPENVEQYSRLRERMRQAGIKTLIADGESVGDPKAFEPYLRPKRLVDVLQMDIRRGGFIANLQTARRGHAAGAMTVPHNWASRIGFLMGLHLAKAVEGVPAAEDDRSTCDALVEEGYSFKDGYYSVSEQPGLGVHVAESVYREQTRGKEIVVS